MSLEELRSCKREKTPGVEGLLQNQIDGLNSEIAEEHPLHKNSNLKEVDADDEPDEGPSPIHSDVQR